MITADEGLHARPAADLVRFATDFAGSIRLRVRTSEWVDARSVLSVMMLAVERGDTLVVRVDGEHADAALDDIERILAEHDE